MKPESAPLLILNVDDTHAARYAKTRILMRAGYDVVEAASGEEALALAHERNPDMVLLDTKLPDINGFEVSRRLKADSETRPILILQTSASFIDSAARVRALDGGADNYLFEPIEPEELVANVRALLRLGRVERELREADRRKDRFLAILAHELRNPLGPIKSAVELLRQIDPYAPPLQESARQMILRQTDHMVRLVDDLLDVSRISQGKINLRTADISLQRVVHAAIETAGSSIEARKHKLDITLPQQEVMVHGDAVRLAQSVGNLLHNAAKFTPPGGVISVSLEQQGADALIRVTDSGIGIPPEDLEAIFELFAQARHSPDRVQDGLGIGLALVRTLVDLHGGSVSVSSPGAEQGSTFAIRLAALQDAAPQVETADPAVPRLGPRRILVVDDNVDSAEMISSLLELEGHELQTANDGASAIAEALRFHPEVVFLDIGLPDMSGFEVSRRLRALPELQPLVLVALTGYGQESDRSEAASAGFDRHLTKPVAYTTLLEVMEQLLPKKPG